MQSHGPNASILHVPGVLVGKLERDWADFFSVNQLEQGRPHYRDSEIREVALTAADAIIHRKVDRKRTTRSSSGRPTPSPCASSSTDAELARAIAVAGLHEIEELVATRFAPARRTAPEPAPGAGAAANEAPPKARNGGPARPAAAVFSDQVEGLTIPAFW